MELTYILFNPILIFKHKRCKKFHWIFKSLFTKTLHLSVWSRLTEAIIPGDINVFLYENLLSWLSCAIFYSPYYTSMYLGIVWCLEGRGLQSFFKTFEIRFTHLIDKIHPFQEKARCSIFNLLLTEALKFTLKVIRLSFEYVFIIQTSFL